MDLKDMILVMENYKGTERNMLMTLEDYKKFVAIDDMSELADQMLLLGRTLAEGFTEYYRAANVTVFAKFCRDDVELGRFLQGYYNDSKKFYDKPFAYSAELEEKLARQYELNAQLDLENAKAMDADLGGPDKEKSEDRIENAGIVAEDKGIYMPDRNRKR